MKQKNKNYSRQKKNKYLKEFLLLQNKKKQIAFSLKNGFFLIKVTKLWKKILCANKF